LLICGVQKGGTTSLYYYLKEHPQLLAPVRKELHFFDDEDRVDWTAPDYSLYHAHFPVCAIDRMAFEATPIYVSWPRALNRIQAYNPGMRLIILFRDPIERAWSHWCMEYSRGAEVLPFAVAIRQGRWRLRGIAPSADAWRVYNYVERGFYARQVRRVLNLFPRHQVLFLRSRDLRDNHQATLGQIAEFLRIEPFPSLVARFDQRQPSFDYPSDLTREDVGYLSSIFLPDLTEFSALTGLRVDDWLTNNSAADEITCRQ
jgi:hypothetical protein